MKGKKPVKTRKQKKLEKEKQEEVEKAMKEMERVNRRLKFDQMCAQVEKFCLADELGREITVMHFDDWIGQSDAK